MIFARFDFKFDNTKQHLLEKKQVLSTFKNVIKKKNSIIINKLVFSYVNTRSRFLISLGPRKRSCTNLRYPIHVFTLYL